MILKLLLNLMVLPVLLPINLALLPVRLLLKVSISPEVQLWTMV